PWGSPLVDTKTNLRGSLRAVHIPGEAAGVVAAGDDRVRIGRLSTDSGAYRTRNRAARYERRPREGSGVARLRRCHRRIHGRESSWERQDCESCGSTHCEAHHASSNGAHTYSKRPRAYDYFES